MALQLNADRKDATDITKQRNKKLWEEMKKEYLQIEEEDVEDVKKHLILELGDDNITDEEGNVIWNRQAQKKLIEEQAPDTVNPYLWKICQDEYPAGVVEIAKGFYIVIGLDSASVGFIRSEHGWIVQDCAGSVAAAQLAVQLVEKAIHENIHDNVKAIIYSHTHTDHLDGVEGIISKDKVGNPEGGKVPVIAPAEYEQSLVDDNLYAGIAMSRRLQYQCGLFLPHDEKGWVSLGLSSTLGVRGKRSVILPTQFIEEDGTITVDGVRLTFILTPNTETRAHMCTYFNDYKVLFLADNSVGTLHNTYTMRGAPVRDANYWGKILFHLYRLYGEEVEAIYQGHGLPHFKMKHRPDNLKHFLLDNAVSYKYTHDQALLLANEGYSMNEIGNHLEIPESISRTWYTRGHYGSYSFNARGTYQKYLGFYDGNPVNLLPLPERELAENLIEYIGSEELVLEKAWKDYEKGKYQWVATITNHVVYYNPSNMEARYLCADALEQLAYQAESSLWRNAYLAGALELRNPDFASKLNIQAMDNKMVVPYVSVELLLDHLGINFDGSQAVDIDRKFYLKVETEYHLIHLYKGTILHEKVSKKDINEKEEIASVTKTQLYQLAVKKYTEENPSDKGKNPALELIEQYVTDTSLYKNFHLIEPIAQLR